MHFLTHIPQEINMSQKVYCIAMFRAKPGHEDALFKILQSLEPNSQREDGCIQYLVTRQVKSDFATGEVFHSYSMKFGKITRLLRLIVNVKKLSSFLSYNVLIKMV